MRKWYWALGVILVMALAVTELVSPSPLLIWNKTESVDKVLYLQRSGHFQRGDIVAVMPPDHVRSFLTERDYLSDKVPLLKRIAAMENDYVCRVGEQILINNVVVTVAKKDDSLGRSMPVWKGCFILQADQYFLLNSHPKSLDGRYFGVTNSVHILGKYRLIMGIGTDEADENSGVSVEEFEASRRAR